MVKIKYVSVASMLLSIMCLLIATGVAGTLSSGVFGLMLLGVVGFLAGLILYLFVNLRVHLDIIDREILALHSAVTLTQVSLPRPAFFLRHAVAPDLIELVSEIIRRRSVARVLELGCGTSSLYITSLLPQESAGGKLVCLEDSSDWARLVQLEMNQIATPHSAVRVVHAPLCANSTTGATFYDLEAARLDEDAPFDVVLIDGPSDVRLRASALTLLTQFLAPGSVLVLDDGDQIAIREAVHNFVAASSAWSVRYYPTVKGTWVLWKSQSALGLPLP